MKRLPHPLSAACATVNTVEICSRHTHANAKERRRRDMRKGRWGDEEGEEGDEEGCEEDTE